MRDTRFEDTMLTQLMDAHAEADGEQLLREFEASGAVIPAELDAGCQDLIEQMMGSAGKKRIIVLPFRWLRGATAAAAVLAIVLCGSITAGAFGIDVWNLIAKWTRDVFQSIVYEMPDVSELSLDDARAQETEVTEAIPYHEPMVASTEETAEPTEIPETKPTVVSPTIIASGTCGRAMNWSIDSNATLTISGEGGMNYYAASVDLESIERFPWRNGYEIRNIVIGHGVTSIDDYAFQQMTSVEYVTLPATVTVIGRGAFEGCSALKTVNITNLKAWCGISFNDRGANPLSVSNADLCLNGEAIYDLVIPEGTTYIKSHCFYGSNLTSVTIPGNVKNIGQYAFSNCDRLRSVCFQGTVESIGSAAFSECGNLTDVTLTDGLREIGWYAFGDTGLTSIRIPDTVTETGNEVFRSCDNLQEVILSAGLTRIAIRAFDSCYNLQQVDIPQSVRSIGKEAFASCSNLWRVSIAAGVTTIEESAFKSCGNLTSLDLPYGITSIGTFAFEGCMNLRSITLPDSVSTIGEYAFSNCTNLTKLTLPCSLSSLAGYVFKGCTKLTVLTIPVGVTHISRYAAVGCSNLKHILYKGTEAQWNAIDHSAFRGITTHYQAAGNEVTVTGAGKLECTVCTRNTECTEHTWDNGILTIEPRAEQDGTMTYTCAVCGAVMQQTVPWDEPATEPEEGKTDDGLVEETVPDASTEPTEPAETVPESGDLTEEATEPIIEPTENIEN